ncbi:hypothetical protein O3P69_012996 [Scylla paramamosain]|uniref:Uncharacterized protein n=1 Tax=Scylla paramamosain TaxID=85552 RepID=A0AAW0TR27_SCYPA
MSSVWDVGWRHKLISKFTGSNADRQGSGTNRSLLLLSAAFLCSLACTTPVLWVTAGWGGGGSARETLQLAPRRPAGAAVAGHKNNTCPALDGLQQMTLSVHCCLPPLHSDRGNGLLLARLRPPGAARLAAPQTLLPFSCEARGTGSVGEARKMRKMGKWKEITHLGQQDKMTTLHGERVTRAAGVRGMVRAVGVKAVQFYSHKCRRWWCTRGCRNHMRLSFVTCAYKSTVVDTSDWPNDAATPMRTAFTVCSHLDLDHLPLAPTLL